ncbi:DUF1028 domain-containing protein [Falsiroseomonas oryzae]|uniref:DUF1028 domain-containing protein n=1 Tax=Falsiroseomonas oryzae TaxID=2766473 RepID=UPI0022EB4474|nr:DUF1028 domain-containing protein [Roseomonas sp. MO-31]
MTFTVVARCPRTRMLGVAMATRSIAVGNRCPVVVSRMAAGSVQAVADPRLTLTCQKLIALGWHAPKVVQELADSDPRRDSRQIGVVDIYGHAAAFTGAQNTAYAGHITGDGWLAMANAVVSAAVVEEMAAAVADEGPALEERLMRGIEAGGRAGGQKEGQNSAAILVHADEPFSYLDLRVDLHDEPIAELRRIFDRISPLGPYFQERPYNPQIGRDDHWLMARGLPPPGRH